jgi:predicted Fe-Mo cluster-binding NifX family protein
MIAIPVKTNKENPPVSTLFGKSKWFAFIDDNGGISIKENNANSGREVIENMKAKGVNKLVFHHMGGNPFMLLQKTNIECFHDGGERILLENVLQKLNNNGLVKVDGSNMADYLEKGNMHNGSRKHKHGHNNNEHHNHH